MRPHLLAIDPDAIGAYAGRRFVDAAGTLASRTAAGAVSDHVALLARFAKTGNGDLDETAEVLAMVVTWLLVPWIAEHADPMATLLDAPDGADEDRQALAVVLLAARGRIRLALEDVITVQEIAALTGMDESSISRLARTGKLDRTGAVSSKQYPAPVKGRSARELLRAQGVAGF